MAEPKFWCRIEEKFRRLQALPPQPGEVHHDSHNGLCAHWRGEKNLEGLPAWYFSNAGGGTKKLFRRAAERAAVELGHHGGSTAVFFWLDLLRLDGLFYKPQGDRGYIYQVCNASAEYCLKCETDAQATTNATLLVGAARVQEVFGPIDEVINAIRLAEQADPELRRKREKGDADNGKMLARYRGRNQLEAERQQELLRDAKDYAWTCLEVTVSDLRLRFPASEGGIEAAFNEVKSRLVLRAWEEFRLQHKYYSDCKLDFREFKTALLTEGLPSLEDLAKAAIQSRFALPAKQTDNVIAPRALGGAPGSLKPHRFNRLIVKHFASDRVANIKPPKMTYEFTGAFPQSARAKVMAARLRAEEVLEKKKGPVEEFAEAEALLFDLVLQVFVVFAEEECKLGTQLAVASEEVESECLKFLKSYLKQAGLIGDWPASIGDPEIPDHLQSMIKNTNEWREYRQILQAVAAVQAEGEPYEGSEQDSQDKRSRVKDETVVLLELILKKKHTTLEKWAEERKFGRTTVFDWKALRSAGGSLRGKISPAKSDEIEKAIAADAKALGLPTRTSSD